MTSMQSFVRATSSLPLASKTVEQGFAVDRLVRTREFELLTTWQLGAGEPIFLVNEPNLLGGPDAAVYLHCPFAEIERREE